MHTWFIFVKRGRRKQRERESEGKRQNRELVLELVLCITGLFIQDLLHMCVCLSLLDCASLHLCVLYLAYTTCIISHLEGSFHPKCFAVV